MTLTEALDRTGVIIKNRSLIKPFENDDRPLSDWLCLFDSLGLLGGTL